MYLPRSWTADPDRCATAGVPTGTTFATKPRLARQMLAGALDAGTPAGWVAADEVYGADPQLRADLEARGTGYVLAVACDHRVSLPTGTVRVDTLATGLPRRSWQRLSAGAGAKGPRCYDWAWASLPAPADGHHRWPLVRRTIRTGGLAFYRCYAPRPVPLSALVRVAGARWAIEETFQAGKSQTGLDHYQVRRWTSWHRWTVLAMLAHAFLAVLTARAATGRPNPDRYTHQADPIDLTVAEVRHLFAALVIQPANDLAYLLRQSAWRRRRQSQARHAHYKRRTTDPPK